jgi:DNA-binding IclR family transcriptional regulator
VISNQRVDDGGNIGQLRLMTAIDKRADLNRTKRDHGSFEFEMLRESGPTAQPAVSVVNPERISEHHVDTSTSDVCKVRAARRAIELLDYFDEVHPIATVLQISRHFGWPQSSTSELLAALVDLGVLYKPNRRLYRPTPRAAWLGAGAPSEKVRLAHLESKMDTLVNETGFSVAIVGKVDLDAQIYSWRRGGKDAMVLRTGMKIPLQDSAAGWLLLSTLEDRLWTPTLRRLYAEAPRDRKFDLQALSRELRSYAKGGRGWGPAGFVSGASVSAVLVPQTCPEQPLALAIFTAGAGALATKMLARLAVAMEA